LILDEPTNHLDIKTKDIFQHALLNYHGTLVIVSHDRYFLDCLVQRVIEIRQGNICEYTGNYSYFIEKRRAQGNAVPAIAVNAATATPKEGDEAAATKNIYKTKEEKRQEAEARNKLAGRRGDLKKKIAALEERVGFLEGQKADKEKELCEPAVCRMPGKIKTLNQELKVLSQELHGLYDEWHGLAQELERIDSAVVGQ